MRYPILALTLLLAWPASAATYMFDFVLGTSIENGRYFDYGLGSYADGDIAVTGYVETDGTFGTLTDSNLIAWSFTLDGKTKSVVISSDAASFGRRSEAFGEFTATETAFSPIPGGQAGFYEYNEGYDAYGSTVVLDYALVQTAYSDDRALFWETVGSCSSLECGTDSATLGEYADSGRYGAGEEVFVGTALPTVPLPAGAGFLIGGLGIFALIRHGRKNQPVARQR